MAIYRLTSYPDAPPSLQRQGRAAAILLTIAVSVAVASFFLMLHAESFAIWHGWLRPAIRVALIVPFTIAGMAAVGSVLVLLARPKLLREYGRQSWELTPEGLTYSYPNKPDRFVPIDALVGFSVRKDRTAVRTAAGYTAFLLPASLGEHEAFWNELRLLRVPQLPPPPLAGIWIKLAILLPPIGLCTYGMLSSHNLAVVILCGAAYAAFMARAQWSTLSRQNPGRPPSREPALYVATLPWLLLTALHAWDVARPPHHHVHPSTSAQSR